MSNNSLHEALGQPHLAKQRCRSEVNSFSLISIILRVLQITSAPCNLVYNHVTEHGRQRLLAGVYSPEHLGSVTVTRS